jgi:hypothetical protein
MVRTLFRYIVPTHMNLFNHILQYTSLRELHRIPDGCGVTDTLKIICFEQNLEEKILQHYRLTLTEFKDFLTEHDAIVSGSLFSYLCDDFYREEWTKTDIDIFCHASKHDSLVDAIQQIGETKVDDDLDSLRTYTSAFNRRPDNRPDNPNYSSPVVKLSNIKFPKRFDVPKIQVIGVRYESSNQRFSDFDFAKKVITPFDLDIVRNFYDGHTVVLSPSFVSKVELLSNIDFSHKTFKRIQKYSLRGFKIIMHDDFELPCSKGDCNLHDDKCQDILKVVSNIYKIFHSPHSSIAHMVPLLWTSIRLCLKCPYFMSRNSFKLDIYEKKYKEMITDLANFKSPVLQEYGPYLESLKLFQTM